MSNPEDEIRDLREKNSELVQEVQFWKVAAAQKEKEKLELMKDINELRLKLSRIRSGGAAQVRKLDAALQSTSEDALSHLVQASGSIARTLELVKAYMRERAELDSASPRWSAISGSGGAPERRDERVHKVPPLLIGGQSIQPVVALSRTMLNSSTRLRSPNESNSGTERAIPMRMLQDVYIPLTRIDLEEFENNRDSIDNNSVHDLGIEENNEEFMSESQEIDESFETSRRLDAVMEETEEPGASPARIVTENPLEGPSWLLDVSTNVRNDRAVTPEPDSTTHCDPHTDPHTDPHSDSHNYGNRTNDGLEPPTPSPAECVFTPTIRRRKRGPPQHRSDTSRVLKVVISKMRLSDGDPGASAGDPGASDQDPRTSVGDPGPSGDSPPAKRPVKRSTILPAPVPRRPDVEEENFDAPSPNGATVPGVVISQTDRASSSNHSKSKRQKSQSRVQNNRGHSERGQSDVGQNSSVQSERAPSVTVENEVIDSNRGQSEDHSLNAQGLLGDSTTQEYETRSRSVSRQSAGSDSEGLGLGLGLEGRARRPRKNVVYKEKPLNRKMRR